MESCNSIFAKSLERLMKSYSENGKGKRPLNASQLEELMKLRSEITVTQGYLRRILRTVEKPEQYPEPVNVSIEVGEAIAAALGVSFLSMINPLEHLNSSDLSENKLPIDLEIFSNSMSEAESVAIDVHLSDNRDFIRMATAIQYNGYVTGDEKSSARAINKLIATFSRN